MSGPLKGLKVIEMLGLGPAPLAGQLLADLGAEVIIIDRKSGRPVAILGIDSFYFGSHKLSLPDTCF